MLGCLVELPNGQHVVTIEEGSVKLSKSLKLDNVLYAPNLNCNLILVSQLIDEPNYVVQFTNNLYVIQDRTWRMLICVGEWKDGIYYFLGILGMKAFRVDGVNPLKLWHKHFEHPSFQITQLLPNVRCGKSSEIKNKACDACQ